MVPGPPADIQTSGSAVRALVETEACVFILRNSGSEVNPDFIYDVRIGGVY